MKTYAGVPLDDTLWNELARMYAPSAYSPVGGATYLTDVNNGQVTRRLWKVFGPRGIGWGLELPDLLGVQITPLASGQHECVIPVAYFWYLAIDDKDGKGKEERFTQRILTTGSSKNKEPGYAVSGAMTGCIKKAISYLGHQNALYCGAVTMDNIAEFPIDGAYMSKPDAEQTVVDLAKDLGGVENG